MGDNSFSEFSSFYLFCCCYSRPSYFLCWFSLWDSSICNLRENYSLKGFWELLDDFFFDHFDIGPLSGELFTSSEWYYYPCNFFYWFCSSYFCWCFESFTWLQPSEISASRTFTNSISSEISFLISYNSMF